MPEDPSFFGILAERTKKNLGYMRQGVQNEEESKRYALYREGKISLDQYMGRGEDRKVVGEAVSLPDPLAFTAYQIPALRDTRVSLNPLPDWEPSEPNSFQLGSTQVPGMGQEILRQGYQAVREKFGTSFSAADILATILGFTSYKGKHQLVETMRGDVVSEAALDAWKKKAREEFQRTGVRPDVTEAQLGRFSPSTRAIGGRHSGETGSSPQILPEVLAFIQKKYPDVTYGTVGLRPDDPSVIKGITKAPPGAVDMLHTAPMPSTKMKRKDPNEAYVYMDPAWPGNEQYDAILNKMGTSPRRASVIASSPGSLVHETEHLLNMFRAVTLSPKFKAKSSLRTEIRDFIHERYHGAQDKLSQEFGKLIIDEYNRGTISPLLGHWHTTGMNPFGAFAQMESELAANAMGFKFYKDFYSKRFLQEAKAAGKPLDKKAAESYGRQKAHEEFGPIADMSLISYLKGNNPRVASFINKTLEAYQKRWGEIGAARERPISGRGPTQGKLPFIDIDIEP